MKVNFLKEGTKFYVFNAERNEYVEHEVCSISYESNVGVFYNQNEDLKDEIALKRVGDNFIHFAETEKLGKHFSDEEKFYFISNSEVMHSTFKLYYWNSETLKEKWVTSVGELRIISRDKLFCRKKFAEESVDKIVKNLDGTTETFEGLNKMLQLTEKQKELVREFEVIKNKMIEEKIALVFDEDLYGIHFLNKEGLEITSVHEDEIEVAEDAYILNSQYIRELNTKNMPIHTHYISYDYCEVLVTRQNKQ